MPYINRFIYLSTRVVDGGLCLAVGRRERRRADDDGSEETVEEEEGQSGPSAVPSRYSLFSPALFLSLILACPFHSSVFSGGPACAAR